jgi:DNA polymerase III epsilon subunit-like protein
MKYIFINCIAAGPVDWKRSLTAPNQPPIKDCFMILAEVGQMLGGEPLGFESIDEWPAANAYNLNQYAEQTARGAIVVGHSVDYHHGHLRAKMLEIGTDPFDGRVKTMCTMLGLTGYVTKRNGRTGWPTFDEACDHFGITRAGEESAEDNARCLIQVFLGMLRARENPPEVKIWQERTQK